MASVPNLSQILFYLNPTCEYNNQDVFTAWIDNIGFFSQTVQTTCATTLKPCTEPTVTIQPSSTQTLCQGTSLTFTTSTTGSVLSYQWIDNLSDLSGATSSSLRNQFSSFIK